MWKFEIFLVLSISLADIKSSFLRGNTYHKILAFPGTQWAVVSKGHVEEEQKIISMAWGGANDII